MVFSICLIAPILFGCARIGDISPSDRWQERECIIETGKPCPEPPTRGRPM